MPRLWEEGSRHAPPLRDRPRRFLLAPLRRFLRGVSPGPVGVVHQLDNPSRLEAAKPLGRVAYDVDPCRGDPIRGRSAANAADRPLALPLPNRLRDETPSEFAIVPDPNVKMCGPSALEFQNPTDLSRPETLPHPIKEPLPIGPDGCIIRGRFPVRQCNHGHPRAFRVSEVVSRPQTALNRLDGPGPLHLSRAGPCDRDRRGPAEDAPPFVMRHRDPLPLWIASRVEPLRQGRIPNFGGLTSRRRTFGRGIGRGIAPFEHVDARGASRSLRSGFFPPGWIGFGMREGGGVPTPLRPIRAVLVASPQSQGFTFAQAAEIATGPLDRGLRRLDTAERRKGFRSRRCSSRGGIPSTARGTARNRKVMPDS